MALLPPAGTGKLSCPVDSISSPKLCIINNILNYNINNKSNESEIMKRYSLHSQSARNKARIEDRIKGKCGGKFGIRVTAKGIHRIKI